MKDTQPPNIAAYVREQFFKGIHDPDEIARAFLNAALDSPDPHGWLIQCVRHSTGSAFSSLQAALRGTQKQSGTAHQGNGPQRQRHNEGYVYNPWDRAWIPLGRATVPDFEAAIAWHQGMIAGHENTIDEYRGYIQRIKEAGATCLDDI
jgi:hypothetical protein